MAVGAKLYRVREKQLHGEKDDLLYAQTNTLLSSDY